MQQLNVLTATIKREKDPQQLAILQRQQNNLYHKIGRFKQQLQEHYPNYFYQPYSHQVVNATTIQKQLPQQTALLEFHVGETGVYLFYIDQQDLIIQKLACTKGKLRKKQNNFVKYFLTIS